MDDNNVQLPGSEKLVSKMLKRTAASASALSNLKTSKAWAMKDQAIAHLDYKCVGFAQKHFE